MKCSFSSTARSAYFCKEPCTEENVLLRTEGARAEGGRYSMQYETRPQGGRVSVSITQLNKADSGLYGCGLYQTKRSYAQIEVVVVDGESFVPNGFIVTY